MYSFRMLILFSISPQNLLGVRNLCRLAAIFFSTIVTILVFAHSKCGMDHRLTLLCLSLTTTVKCISPKR